MTWRAPWRFGSGPDVAALFGTLLALVSLIAWVSLGVQVRQLVGAHGLMPLDRFVEAARAAGVATFGKLPTIFLWTQSDGALVAGVVVGAGLSLAALAGIQRRLCFALSTFLYLSYATACRTFLSFQWDNLLLECGLLATFLPADRAAPVVHFLFRVLLFKLYFESGIAKWQSPLHDWQDGSAMTYYYETAPLPTVLAWFAHNAPAWWHHLESRATLVLELVLPLAIFGPRRLRLVAAAGFTGFQLLNVATANYGFFCYLAVALHVFLLDDRDVARVRRFIRPRPHPRPEAPGPRPTDDPAQQGARTLARVAGAGGVAAYLSVSLIQALLAFGGGEPGRVMLSLARLVEADDTLRLVNTYHLFAAITRERIEPEFQTLDQTGSEDDDASWTPHHLRWKPGDPRRAPRFVAPHQPRLDFQLWFHGLGFRRGRPAYVHELLELLCDDASDVRSFFLNPLPPHPRATRVVYWQYHFTTPAERRSTGAWWRRELVATTPPVRCPAVP
jgi:hypothetical protein